MKSWELLVLDDDGEWRVFSRTRFWNQIDAELVAELHAAGVPAFYHPANSEGFWTRYQKTHKRRGKKDEK